MENPLHLHESICRKAPNHTLIGSSMVMLHRVQLQLFVHVTVQRKRDFLILASFVLRCEAPRELWRQHVRFRNALQLELRAQQKRYGRSRG